MSNTKNPHYVPAAYLQFWSFDGIPNGRKSIVNVTDGSGTEKRSVDRIAKAKYLYSRKNSKAAEEHFQKFENSWSKLIFDFLQNKGPKPQTLLAILLQQSCHFLIRNRSFEKKSNQDRINLYKNSVDTYWREIILEGEMVKNIEEANKILSEKWTCLLLKSASEKFITSDNPTLILNSNNKNSTIIYLPLTPLWAFFSYKNCSIKETENNISDQDIEYLNNYTIGNCNREVYSKNQLEEIDVKRFSELLNQRPKRNSWFEDDMLHFESYDYPILDMKLSFIESK